MVIMIKRNKLLIITIDINVEINKEEEAIEDKLTKILMNKLINLTIEEMTLMLVQEVEQPLLLIVTSNTVNKMKMRIQILLSMVRSLLINVRVIGLALMKIAKM